MTVAAMQMALKGADEGVCASVVASGDAAPFLEPSEHAFDGVPLPVEFGVAGDGFHAAGAAGDAGCDAASGEGAAEAVAVIALVADRGVGVGQDGEHGSGAAIIADLAFGQQQDQGLAVCVADRVELRVEPAPGAADTARKSPFLSRLAAVRCAFRWVASIDTVPVASLSAARAAKMRSNTPAPLHRTKRLQSVLCGQ